MMANFTADDELQMYADGCEIPIPQSESKNWRNASVLHILKQTRLIAVRAYNGQYNASILGSIENGIVTDETWKCSDTYEENSNKILFDDSHWAPATVVANYGDGPWGKIAHVSDMAKWIWTGLSPMKNSTTYYRKHITGLI